MRIVVAAVGRLKQGPERELAEHYTKRAADAGRALGLHPIDVIEIKESRNREAGRRMVEESIALTESIPDAAALTVLDGRGENLSSDALATRLRRWQEDGKPAVAFVIGGPDGLADSLRDRAQLRLAFGTATWPHQVVRIMLLEQLYRATTILSGHPYHRQ